MRESGLAKHALFRARTQGEHCLVTAGKKGVSLHESQNVMHVADAPTEPEEPSLPSSMDYLKMDQAAAAERARVAKSKSTAVDALSLSNCKVSTVQVVFQESTNFILFIHFDPENGFLDSENI